MKRPLLAPSLAASFAALIAMAPALAASSPFDLRGPALRVSVTHEGTILPVGQVPNLAAGDTITVAPDFPDQQGARYVLMDYMDSAASVYVVEALMGRGGAFCALQKAAADPAMAEWALTDGPPTQILGIMPPDNRPGAEYREGEDGVVTVAMRRCPDDMLRPDPLPEQTARTQQIPLLVGFRRTN